MAPITPFGYSERRSSVAGPDRPYRFDLLKVGDHVAVKGGGAGEANAGVAAVTGSPGPATGARVARPGGGQGNRLGQDGPNAQGAGAPVARRVMVRPAGESAGEKRNRATGQPAARQIGGSDGSDQ